MEQQQVRRPRRKLLFAVGMTIAAALFLTAAAVVYYYTAPEAKLENRFSINGISDTRFSLPLHTLIAVAGDESPRSAVVAEALRRELSSLAPGGAVAGGTEPVTAEAAVIVTEPEPGRIVMNTLFDQTGDFTRERDVDYDIAAKSTYRIDAEGLPRARTLRSLAKNFREGLAARWNNLPAESLLDADIAGLLTPQDSAEAVEIDWRDLPVERLYLRRGPGTIEAVYVFRCAPEEYARVESKARMRFYAANDDETVRMEPVLPGFGGIENLHVFRIVKTFDYRDTLLRAAAERGCTLRYFPRLAALLPEEERRALVDSPAFRAKGSGPAFRQAWTCEHDPELRRAIRLAGWQRRNDWRFHDNIEWMSAMKRENLGPQPEELAAWIGTQLSVGGGKVRLKPQNGRIGFYTERPTGETVYGELREIAPGDWELSIGRPQWSSMTTRLTDSPECHHCIDDLFFECARETDADGNPEFVLQAIRIQSSPREVHAEVTERPL